MSRKTVQMMLSPEAELPNQLGIPVTRGLGVFFRDSGRELLFLHPGENAPGAQCMLIAAPASGKGLVLMSNGMQGALLHFEMIPALMKEFG